MIIIKHGNHRVSLVIDDDTYCHEFHSSELKQIRQVVDGARGFQKFNPPSSEGEIALTDQIRNSLLFVEVGLTYDELPKSPTD